jgi:hypothetical protein
MSHVFMLNVLNWPGVGYEGGVTLLTPKAREDTIRSQHCAVQVTLDALQAFLGPR